MVLKAWTIASNSSLPDFPLSQPLNIIIFLFLLVFDHLLFLHFQKHLPNSISFSANTWALASHWSERLRLSFGYFYFVQKSSSGSLKLCLEFFLLPLQLLKQLPLVSFFSLSSSCFLWTSSFSNSWLFKSSSSFLNPTWITVWKIYFFNFHFSKKEKNGLYLLILQQTTNTKCKKSKKVALFRFLELIYESVSAECSKGRWVKTKLQNYLHPVVTPRAHTRSYVTCPECSRDLLLKASRSVIK